MSEISCNEYLSKYVIAIVTRLRKGLSKENSDRSGDDSQVRDSPDRDDDKTGDEICDIVDDKNSIEALDDLRTLESCLRDGKSNSDAATEEEGDGQSIEESESNICLSTDQLKVIYKYIKKENPQVTLKDLLKGCRISLPSLQPATSTPSAEQIQRRQQLIARQEARLYNNMVYGKMTTPEEDELRRLDTQFSSMRNQLSVSGNMIAAVVATFGIGYYVALQLKYDERVSMAIGLAAATLIMVIEMLLFIIRAFRVDVVTRNQMIGNKII